MWGAIIDCLPSEDSNTESRKEVWELFNISDKESLDCSDLEKGVATMCQTEDHFDCQPAVLAALDFAKTANNGGIEDAEMAKKIDFEEFGAFLQAVKLYYSFCEIFKNNDVDPEKMIKKKKFLEKDSVADMMELLGEELVMEAEFNDLDNENTEKVMFSEIISWAFKKTMTKNIAAKK